MNQNRYTKSGKSNESQGRIKILSENESMRWIKLYYSNESKW